MGIIVNALRTTDATFLNFDCTYQSCTTSNLQQLNLALEGEAEAGRIDSHFHGGGLFFRGKNEAVDTLTKDGLIQTQGQRIPKTLSPANYEVLKVMFYRSLRRKLRACGFSSSHGVDARLARPIPAQVSNFMIAQLNVDIVLVLGIRYMLEIRPSGHGLLWIDSRTLVFDWKLKKYRDSRAIMAGRDAQGFRRFSVVDPIERLSRIKGIVDKMTVNNNVPVDFADGSRLTFERTLTSV